MTQTITIRYKLYVDGPTPLVEVSEAYRDVCNHISEYMFDRGMDNVPSFRELHDSLYLQLRTLYGLKSQMAQSVIKTVLARYSTLLQIEYRAAAKGIRVVYVDPANTSRTCPH